MISLTDLLIEGKYDSLVTKLSNELLRTIKDSHSAVTNPSPEPNPNSKALGTYNDADIYYRTKSDAPEIGLNGEQAQYFKVIKNKEIPLDFHLGLFVQWIGNGFGEPLIDGGAYNDNNEDTLSVPYIEIMIQIDPATVPQAYNKISMDLKDVLRHELEHLTQAGWNAKQGKHFADDQDIRQKIAREEVPAKTYLLLPQEIPAMIHGLYFKAKKSKQPLRVVIDKYFDPLLRLKTTDGRPLFTLQDKKDVLKVWRTHLPKLGINQTI